MLTTLLALLVALLPAPAPAPAPVHLMSACPEDAVPVGTGDFSGGFWSRYTCVTRDSVATWDNSKETAP